MSDPLADSNGWGRRSRRYSPFDRSPGLRRVPDDAITFAFLGSVLLHVVLAFCLVKATNAPAWSAGATLSLVSLVEPGSPEPAAPPSEVASASSTPTSKPITSELVTSRPPAASRPSVLRASPAKASSPSAPRVAAVPSSHLPVSAAPASPSPVSLPALQSLEPHIAESLGGGTPDQGSGASLLAAVPDSPLDAGPMEPPSSPAPTTATPARTLTQVSVMPKPASPIATPPTAAAVKPVETPAIAPSKQVAASPLGLGFGLASIRLDGPRERTTDQSVGIITGSVGGGPAARLVVYVNGEPIAVDPKQGVFELTVPLNPGGNSVRAVAVGPAGVESEDLIRIDYTTPPAVVSEAVVLASPADGLTLGPEDPPVVVVEGQVTDPTADYVWIVANDRRMQASVRHGRFRQVLVVSDPLVRVWAETTSTGGQPERSRTITVQRSASAASTGLLVVQWPRAVEGFDVEVSATWRAQADRLDAPAQTMTLPPVGKGPSGTPPDVFYLRGMKPGVYTLAVRSRGTVPPGDIRSTFYLSDRAGLTARALGPARLNGGRAVLAKVLLPYGVLWSQDDWFSGVSESVDTVTKFRVPEGISWIERKAELP